MSIEKTNSTGIKSELVVAGKKWGDTVYTKERSLNYVGRMPGAPEKYLIFSSGEYLTHVYIRTNGTFNGRYFQGEYDPTFFDQLEIEEHKERIEQLRNKIEFLEKIRFN